MRKIQILFLMLLNSLVSFAHAETFTLEQVVKRVLVTHPAVDAARWDAKSAKSVQTSSAFLPDPEVGVSFEDVPLRAGSLGNSGMTSYSVSQEIPFPSKIVTQVQSAKAEYQAKEHLVDSAKRAEVVEAKKTYFELVAAQNEAAALRTVIGYYDQAIASLSGSYESGGGKNTAPANSMNQTDAGMSGSSIISDLFMAKMKRAEAQTQLQDMQHKQASLSARLNLLMGRDPLAALKLVLPTLPKLKWNVHALEAKVLAQNSDLQAMERLVAKSKKEVSLAKQSYLPDVTSEFAYEQRQDMENAYRLTLNFKVPLWIPKNAAQVKSAYADQKRMEKEFDSQRLNARADLHYLWEHANWHSQILQKYRSEVLPFARSAVNTALSDYQIDRQAILANSTLTSLINYHQAQVMYWDLWQDYQSEYAILEQLVGEDL